MHGPTACTRALQSEGCSCHTRSDWGTHNKAEKSLHSTVLTSFQLPGNSSGEPPTQHLPPTGVLKDLAKPPSPQIEVIPTPDNPMKQPIKLHCGKNRLLEVGGTPGSPSPMLHIIPNHPYPPLPCASFPGTQTLVETAVAPGRSDASQQTK